MQAVGAGPAPLSVHPNHGDESAMNPPGYRGTSTGTRCSYGYYVPDSRAEVWEILNRRGRRIVNIYPIA
jgi:hypothetical protein